MRTPFLAAVVKGTVFAVNTDAKPSTVAVTRGKVGVQSANGSHGDIGVGQTATVAKGQGVSVGHAPGTTRRPRLRRRRGALGRRRGGDGDCDGRRRGYGFGRLFDSCRVGCGFVGGFRL